jgi:hypothetical protein
MSEERAPYNAGQEPPEQIRLIVDRGLKCWQAELRLKQAQATPGSEFAAVLMWRWGCGEPT